MKQLKSIVLGITLMLFAGITFAAQETQQRNGDNKQPNFQTDTQNGKTQNKHTKPEFTTGEDFQKICSEMGSDKEKKAWCKGFITGFDQNHTTLSYLMRKNKEKGFDIKKDGLLYCPPPDISHTQAINIIVSYAQKHPAQAKKLPAGVLAWYALHDEFACKK